MALNNLRNLETVAEVAASRAGKPIPKGQSRLQATKEAAKLTVIDEAAFKREVRDRDTWHCRRCLRKVEQTMSRVPQRAEVHHVHGRRGDLRFEPMAALLLCLDCHEKVTGRIAEKWIVVATKTFTMPSLPGKALTDCRAKVTFERVA